ncbi:MAG: SulP family inorganic anion transporter [Gammaproteobacteria bacterium]|nr:SulP family inorganic anion transporter [Gammaproteobacteria bacterium]
MSQHLLRWAADVRASIVVFLVAVPLCLGIALGSGAPLAGGVVAGIVGGIVVGALSGSALSVSGPAAGLTAIVAAAILAVGSWPAFLAAVVVAGLLQIAAGLLRLGSVADFVPNAVIRGMLAAIGVLLILKQLPHLVGYDVDFEGDFALVQPDGGNTFGALGRAFGAVTPPAAVAGLVAIALLWLWERPALKRIAALAAVPGPLVGVVAAVGVSQALGQLGPNWRLASEHLVQLPVVDGPLGFYGHLAAPAFDRLADGVVWKTAVTIAIVASLETLLSVAAVDKLDPLNRVTPPNRELVAQGVGNTVSGLLGGLPMTSVIVRSSANLNAGARSNASTILHGALLLIAALFAARWLNLIPLSALAAILVFTGYKLAKVEIFRELWAQGREQFIPFVLTILAILATDLLVGIGVGIAIGVAFHIHSNFSTALMLVHDGNHYLLRLRKDISFFVKPALRRTLETIPPHSYLLIDLSRADLIDRDIVDVINEFAHHVRVKNIRVELRRNPARASHQALHFDLPVQDDQPAPPAEVTP